MRRVINKPILTNTQKKNQPQHPEITGKLPLNSWKWPENLDRKWNEKVK